MAYSNVKIPRFYIDEISNFKKLGVLSCEKDKNLEFIGLENCNFQKIIDANNYGARDYKWRRTDDSQIGVNYRDFDIGNLGVSTRAFFGNLNFTASLGTVGVIGMNQNITESYSNPQSVINSNISNGYNTVTKNGFSLSTGDISDFIGTGNEGTYQSLKVVGEYTDSLGCYTFGFYYDMPFAPDLNMQMLTEFDGFSNIKTTSGKTITQANYMGKPWWYDTSGNKIEPWSLYDGDANHGLSKRNGRRVWKLNFKYMSDSDLFSSNLSNTYHLETSTGYNDSDYVGDDTVTIFTQNIATDDSFQAAVLNRISNGERFIFQADKDSRNPSDFAICILDGSDFSIRQSAINVYDINMTIREVW